MLSGVRRVCDCQVDSLRNMEVIAFRDRDALVTVSYTFRYASPTPDAERALTTLCPVNT